MKSVKETIASALAGNKVAISRLISLIERGDDQAPYILQKIYPFSGSAYYIGITGAPGAGKSTMVDKLVRRFCRDGFKVGVVAVDPSSPFSGGALLGDRVRMNIKKKEYDYFFRSMSSGRVMGGLARTTKEAARILDACGRDIIIIETVGVGQSEIDITKATDTVVVMLTPESGDGVQIMKAGLIEAADIFVVNKHDRPGAENMIHSLKGMLSRIEARLEWVPPIFSTSAMMNQGIDKLYAGMISHQEYLGQDDNLELRRKRQVKEELRRHVEAECNRMIWSMVKADQEIDIALSNVWDHRIDPQSAARELVTSWFGRVKDLPVGIKKGQDKGLHFG